MTPLQREPEIRKRIDYFLKELRRTDLSWGTRKGYEAWCLQALDRYEEIYPDLIREKRTKWKEYRKSRGEPE